MWKDSEKSQVFMVLWLVASYVVAGTFLPMMFAAFSVYYGVVGLYEIWKENK